MTHRIVIAALAFGGLLATSGQADAQFFRPYRPGYGVRTQVTYYHAYPPPVVAYGVVPAGYPAYASPYGAAPADGGAAFVRSLYLQYLGREPDPAGLQAWMNTLAANGGNTAAVTQSFLQSAQNEIQTRGVVPAGYP